MPKDLVLGIDTSNYTSSVALADAARDVAADLREQLPVKRGLRGLRQSEAFFRHVDRLPALAGALLRTHRDRIGAVAVSEKPRPVAGAYMPVFRAGLRLAALLADALGAPLFCFSHQEGHIRAALHGTELRRGEAFLAWQISGGTSELLLAEDGGARLSIIGGGKDISFGQLLDRVGVALGMDFPAGAALDALATAAEADAQGGAGLARIPADGFFFNLSGMETQCLRAVRGGADARVLSRAIFENIADCLLGIGAEAARRYGAREMLFAGGVSASIFLRRRIAAAARGAGPAPVFGDAALCGDNAVGIALLGAEKLWP
ncbi:MAG: peptidase M22 [Clostridiales Family XIII bacterium]|jgi:N6-L-threonylcarbamoyladenine synthase|nr:peptidase M22 [Clostridiales Family XIII bacterium]